MPFWPAAALEFSRASAAADGGNTTDVQRDLCFDVEVFDACGDSQRTFKEVWAWATAALVCESSSNCSLGSSWRLRMLEPFDAHGCRLHTSAYDELGDPYFSDAVNSLVVYVVVACAQESANCGILDFEAIRQYLLLRGLTEAACAGDDYHSWSLARSLLSCGLTVVTLAHRQPLYGTRTGVSHFVVLPGMSGMVCHAPDLFDRCLAHWALRCSSTAVVLSATARDAVQAVSELTPSCVDRAQLATQCTIVLSAVAAVANDCTTCVDDWIDRAVLRVHQQTGWKLPRLRAIATCVCSVVHVLLKDDRSLDRLCDLELHALDWLGECFGRVPSTSSSTASGATAFLPGLSELEARVLPALQVYYLGGNAESEAHPRRHSEDAVAVPGASLSGAVDFVREQTGLVVSRTFVYRRLLPRYPGSFEAARHHVLIRVRPAAPVKALLNNPVDGHYCAALVKYRRLAYGSLAPADGNKTPFLQASISLARDDKAHVRLTNSPIMRPQKVTCYKMSDGTIRRPVLGISDYGQVNAQSVIAQGILVLSCRDQQLAVHPRHASQHGARNSGQSIYVLRHGAEGQSAAYHLSELLFAISSNLDQFVRDGAMCRHLLIICDGGAYEAPTTRPSRICYALVRWLFGLRALTVCTYAGGNSCLSPAERPHAAFGRAVAGNPIGHLDDAAAALGEVQRRVTQRTFSGHPMRVSCLLPGEASNWLPACFAEFVSPHTNAQRIRELSSTVVVLPEALVRLCALVGVTVPQLPLTFAQLERAASVAAGCVSAGKYCVDFIACGNTAACFGCGIPRGGALTAEERLLFVWPVAKDLVSPRTAFDNTVEAHFLDFSECLMADLSAPVHLPTAHANKVEHTQCSLRSLFAQVDCCCPSVVAKAAVAERKAALASMSIITSAADLVSFSASELHALATRCCLLTKDMHAELLHQATVSFNRSAGRKKKVGVPRVDMSREQLNKECTADALRTWLVHHKHMTAAAARGLNKGALVDAVLGNLVAAVAQV